MGLLFTEGGREVGILKERRESPEKKSPKNNCHASGQAVIKDLTDHPGADSELAII